MIMEKYMRNLVLLAICISLVVCASDKENLYHLSNSAVMNLNAKNFHNQITFNRSKDIVSVVHYYKLNGIYESLF